MTDRAWLAVDRWARRLKRVGPGREAWKAEACEFMGITPEDWPLYWTKHRDASLVIWDDIRSSWKSDWVSYYQMPYFMMRGAWYRRHDTFYTILRTMGERGLLLDYGSGVGTVTRWLLQRRPGWFAECVDLPGPSQQFLAWRMRRDQLSVFAVASGAPLGWAARYDTIVCLDVLEHLEKPHDTLVDMLYHLKPGGHLFVSMSPDTDHENIGGKYLPDVLAVLDRTCDEHLGLTDTDHYGHYVKR